MDVIERFSFQREGIDFSVSVVCYNEFALFGDMYKMTDTHKGGVTIQNPNFHRNGYKFAIPEFSLAERTKILREQGDANPCATAYQKAQEALERDLNASDYGFQVSAEINGVTLLDGETMGCSFDYSYDDDDQLIDVAIDCFNENGIKEEAIEAAKSAASQLLAQMGSLKNLVA